VVQADKWLKFFTKDRFEKHLTAEDIISEFVIRVLMKSRVWNQEKCSDFNDFAYSSIKSIVEGKVSSRRIVESDAEITLHNEDEEGNSSIFNSYSTEKNYILTALENKEQLDKIYERLIGDPNNPDECGLVFLLWREGQSNKEIAEYFNNDVAKVANIKKQILYKLKTK